MRKLVLAMLVTACVTVGNWRMGLIPLDGWKLWLVYFAWVVLVVLAMYAADLKAWLDPVKRARMRGEREAEESRRARTERPIRAAASIPIEGKVSYDAEKGIAKKEFARPAWKKGAWKGIERLTNHKAFPKRLHYQLAQWLGPQGMVFRMRLRIQQDDEKA